MFLHICLYIHTDIQTYTHTYIQTYTCSFVYIFEKALWAEGNSMELWYVRMRSRPPAARRMIPRMYAYVLHIYTCMRMATYVNTYTHTVKCMYDVWILCIPVWSYACWRIMCAALLHLSKRPARNAWRSATLLSVSHEPICIPPCTRHEWGQHHQGMNEVNIIKAWMRSTSSRHEWGQHYQGMNEVNIIKHSVSPSLVSHGVRSKINHFAPSASDQSFRAKCVRSITSRQTLYVVSSHFPRRCCFTQTYWLSLRARYTRVL